jgi:hypothetical protein
VSGTLTPDATGGFHLQGTYLSQPAYRRHPTGHWIWSPDAGANFFLSTAPGNALGPFWTKAAPITGNYAPQNGAVGTAAVAAPP